MHESKKSEKEQKLSQLMDGEWYELNYSECVAALCADEALQARWSRYHMIRDVLKNEPVKADQALSARICNAIKDEPAYSNITPFSVGTPNAASTASRVENPLIATTPSQTSTGAHNTATAVRMDNEKPSVFNTGVAGFAIAASVALITVVGLNLFEQQNQPAVSTLASTGTGDPSSTTVQAASVQGASVQNDRMVLPIVDLVANTGSFWVTPASSQRAPDEQRLNKLLSRHIENSPTSVREGLFPYSRLVGYEESAQGR